MNERLRFHLDEHIPPIIAVALRRHGIDVTTSVDAGLRTADDPSHLEFARSQGRVIVTHDAVPGATPGRIAEWIEPKLI